MRNDYNVTKTMQVSQSETELLVQHTNRWKRAILSENVRRNSARWVFTFNSSRTVTLNDV